MKLLVKSLRCFIFIFLITLTQPLTAFANSLAVPNITVIVSCSPDDLTLSLRFANGSIIEAHELPIERKAWERYYRFYSNILTLENPYLEGATLIVHSNEYEFECPLPPSTLETFDNLFTLNLADESIVEGQTLGRILLLVSMRIVLTLLIEGLIFYAFGYRKKVSWKVFIVINLLTQGTLNILLSGHIGSYSILILIFFEFFIFIIETVFCASLLKEHMKSNAIAYALTANFASLMLGGMLISCLPM